MMKVNSYINAETPATSKPTPKPGTTKPKPSNKLEGWDGNIYNQSECIGI